MLVTIQNINEKEIPMTNYTTIKRIFETNISKSTTKPGYKLNKPYFEEIDSFETDKFIGFEVNHIATDVKCKHCNKTISHIKDNKISYCNYDSIGGKTVILKIHKKLYYCPECKRSTVATTEDIKAHAQKSNKIIDLIKNELVENKETYTKVAKRYNISVHNVILHFDKIQEPSPKIDEIRVVSIDELRFIKEKSTYQCIISNAETGEIIEILENRYKPTVLNYFKNNLSHVDIITQDFWDTYRTCANAVGARVCVDKFHFVRFGMWAYGRTRVEIQKDKKIRLMKTWRLQNKSRKDLNKQAKHKLDNEVLNKSKTLNLAYKAKEWYLHLTRLKDIELFREGINKWRKFVEKHELEEFYSIFTTLDNWWEEIENMMTLPYSNGKAERINRMIKQSKNAAFGFRNLKRASKLMKLRSVN